MLGVWRTRDGDELHANGAFQFERLFVRVTPWRVILASSAVGAYLFGLILYLPAEAAVGEGREAVGTVWCGEAAVEPGFALAWRMSPLNTLASLAPAGDVAVRGPETTIAGQAIWRRETVVLRQVEGAASLRLISAMAPRLPFACDGEMTLSATNLALGGGETGQGQLRTGPATCAGAGTATTLPAMIGDLSSDAEGSSLSLGGPDGGEVASARVRTGEGLRLTITPAGAAVLPGMAAATLEIR